MSAVRTSPRRQEDERRSKWWNQYVKLYVENFEMDKKRIPEMQAQIAGLVAGQQEMKGAIDRIEAVVVKFDKIVMGNGEPEKGLVTRMTLLEKTVAALGGTDAWRKNLLAMAIMGILTSVSTAFIVSKLIVR